MPSILLYSSRPNEASIKFITVPPAGKHGRNNYLPFLSLGLSPLWINLSFLLYTYCIRTTKIISCTRICLYSSAVVRTFCHSLLYRHECTYQNNKQCTFDITSQKCHIKYLYITLPKHEYPYSTLTIKLDLITVRPVLKISMIII